MAHDGKSGDTAKPDSAAGEWTEHLEELRRRIIAVLAVFIVAAFGAFAFSGRIAAFLTDRCRISA